MDLPCAHCNGDVERFPSTLVRLQLTESDKKFIRDNYNKMVYQQIADKLGLPKRSVSNYLHRNGLKLTKSEYHKRHILTFFKKGHTPWNSGLSLPNKPNSGQFPKGNKPANTKQPGAISVRYHKRGKCYFIYIKIADCNWQLLSHYNWEKIHGAVPKDHVIRYKDDDTLNCNIENLELISMRENMIRNSPKERKDLVIHSDRYIAARMHIKGRKNQDQFIRDFKNLIELKRSQLLLQRGLNETGSTA